MPPPAVPPHSQDAEQALLGAALLSPMALETLVHDTEPSDFYVPAHALIAQTLVKLYREGTNNADPIVVADALGADVARIGGPATLISLQANTPAISGADRYARIVVEKSTLRRLAATGQDILTMALDPSAVTEEALDKARAMMGTVDLPVGQSGPSPDVLEFLEVQETHDWLVEGLLERGDRVILTAAEGFGKSTLLRQLAVQIAAGIHPFNLRPQPRRRVLIVDVENSAGQVRRKLRPLVETAMDRLDPDMLRIEVRTEGLDLTQRHDARWLTERVAANKPDALVIGPIYKLHADDPNDELPARQVAKVLDMLRARYGVTLLIEAHSPHGEGAKRTLRPYGASLWMRWPEFGYGLAPVKNEPALAYFQPWRGARDARDWPTKLVKTTKWPWSAAT